MPIDPISESPGAEDIFVKSLLAAFTKSWESRGGTIRDLDPSQEPQTQPEALELEASPEPEAPQPQGALQSPHFTPPIEPGTEPPDPAEPSLKHGSGHLAYGGTPAKTPYKIGCKPSAGAIFRKQKRYELIARMENAGLPEMQIATLLGISKARLRSTKQHPDYLKARMAVTLGLIVDTDASLDQIREQRKEMLRQMLPPALQVIANAVNSYPQNFAEKRLQISVAQDILDREGTFAKISRSEIKPVEHFDWEQSDVAATRAVNVIKGTLRVSQSQVSSREASEAESSESKRSIEKIIEISRAFSTGRTPSPELQQQALKELELDREEA